MFVQISVYMHRSICIHTRIHIHAPTHSPTEALLRRCRDLRAGISSERLFEAPLQSMPSLQIPAKLMTPAADTYRMFALGAGWFKIRHSPRLCCPSGTSSSPVLLARNVPLKHLQSEQTAMSSLYTCLHSVVGSPALFQCLPHYSEGKVLRFAPMHANQPSDFLGYSDFYRPESGVDTAPDELRETSPVKESISTGHKPVQTKTQGVKVQWYHGTPCSTLTFQTFLHTWRAVFSVLTIHENWSRCRNAKNRGKAGQRVKSF